MEDETTFILSCVLSAPLLFGAQDVVSAVEQ
jgi:hypothetical protein